VVPASSSIIKKNAYLVDRLKENRSRYEWGEKKSRLQK
jgi:hypothetical protein